MVRFGAAVALALFLCAPTVAAAASGSTVAVDPRGRGTWVLNPDHDEIALVGSAGSIVKRLSVGRWPSALVAKADGTVFVSCRGAGRITAISPEFATYDIAVGFEPRALELSEDGRHLYVGLIVDRAIAVVDTDTRAVVGRRALEFAPSVLALAGDRVAAADLKSGSVVFLSRRFDDEQRSVTALNTPDRDGLIAWNVRALIASEDALVVVHNVVDTGVASPPTFGGYGGAGALPMTAGISLIRGPDFSSAAATFLGEVAAIDVDGAAIANGLLFLASRGTKQIIVAGIDLTRGELSPHEALNVADGLSGVAIANEGTIHTSAGFGATLVDVGVERFAGRTLWSSKHRRFGSNSISLALLDVAHPLVIRQKWPLGAKTGDQELALGRQLFHDAVSSKISGRMMSCATCHPDGREDGLVWRVAAVRRQTPMLSGRLTTTAPYSWDGSASTLEINIDRTISERLSGWGISTREKAALARYVREGLPPVDVPEPADPELVAKGRAIFHSEGVGCARCHPSDASFADGDAHDIESTTKAEFKDLASLPGRLFGLWLGPRTTQLQTSQAPPKPPEYNTPSLKYLALTAPYYHDGSARTLEELLVRNSDRMGYTSGLDRHGRRALIAYLSSL